MEEKITAIYYIKDLRTDKIIYIGQTKNFIHRKYDHFGSKDNQPIDLYMYNEGRENFIMEKFDIDCTNMTEEERKQKEDELILQYDTLNNGFNILRSGNITKNMNDYLKDYRNTEKYKQYNKQYYETEEYKERKAEYRKTEEYKNYRRQYFKQYYQSEKWKEYTQTEEYKERTREASRKYRLKKKLEKLANETS